MSGRRWMFGLGLAWTASVLGSLVWDYRETQSQLMEQARAELRANFHKDLAFRRWAAQHGGVYVPVTTDTPPDPFMAYLPERDVVTPSGNLLTLINPALMVRQFYALEKESVGVIGKISGLRPLNPDNTPDAWEAAALKRFEEGEEEVSEVAEIDGEEYLRLIRPVFLGEGCIGCHEQQGFELGELNGGVSTSIPLASLKAAANGRLIDNSMGHGVLWLIGLTGIGFGVRQVTRRIAERDEAKDKIQRDYHTQRVIAQVLETSLSSAPSRRKLERTLDLILSTPWFAHQPKGAVFLASESGQRLALEAERGLSSAAAEMCTEIPYGQCLCGIATECQAVIFAPSVDGRHSCTFERMEPHGHYCVPIRSGERLLGVLTLFLSAGYLTNPEEYRFLEAIAHAMANMIERQESQEKLHQHAFYDPLTKLPNRALFMDHLALSFRREDRHPDYQFAVLFLDLDRFKNINDSLGHAAGDQLLEDVALRLKDCVRPGDTVARLGGDEFAFLLDDLEDPHDATRVAERIIESLVTPFAISGHDVFTSASIGISLSSMGYKTMDEALRDADTAMYRAKSLGGARYEMFDEEMHSRAVLRLRSETELRRAVKNAEFELHFQPIVSVGSGRVVGFESLVRWRRAEKGLITPEEFFGIAEETGLIVPIGRWVLHQACRRMRVWQERFPHSPDLRVSVNLSSRQLLHPDLAEQVRHALADTGADATGLRLEITESALMEDPTIVKATLLDLKQTGIRLYLDDFGTGFSSLSYLHSFPFDALKIDRSLVSRLGTESKAEDIVQTIVTIAESLDLGVIAEGVETQAQLDALGAMGCRQVQGTLVSPPVPADQAERFVGARVFSAGSD